MTQTLNPIFENRYLIEEYKQITQKSINLSKRLMFEWEKTFWIGIISNILFLILGILIGVNLK